jgi:two-component system sensor histidine kinase KdpD
MPALPTRLRGSFERVLLAGARPLPAAVGGVLGVVLLGAVMARFDDGLARATQALTLVVPVVVTAVVGGRRAAYLVAAAATVVFSLLVPPVGSFRIHLADDLIALVVFLVVAIVIGTLIAGRIDMLGRVERQRAVLLRSVSHDLRTPLSAIRAAASEVLDGDHDAQTRTKLLHLVGDEAERLDRLVANLLSLSRIEADALKPRRQPVDVAELVGVASERLSRLFADRPLRVDVPGDLPLIHADYVQLEQVVTNLLENAARHTPAGSPVELSARAVPEGIAVAVTDRGPGVDAADMKAIFEPFRSGPVAGSSGIGLAICKGIVEGHGGTITVGTGPEGGARFTVVLPRG